MHVSLISLFQEENERDMGERERETHTAHLLCYQQRRKHIMMRSHPSPRQLHGLGCKVPAD